MFFQIDSIAWYYYYCDKSFPPGNYFLSSMLFLDFQLFNFNYTWYKRRERSLSYNDLLRARHSPNSNNIELHKNIKLKTWDIPSILTREKFDGTLTKLRITNVFGLLCWSLINELSIRVRVILFIWFSTENWAVIYIRIIIYR